MPDRFEAQADPARFGPEHYVPVVKTLRGEFIALAKARPALRRRMTPIIEVANKQGETNKISPRSPLAHVAEDMTEVMGADRFFFLDFHDGLPAKTISRILHEAGSYGLRFVPVVSPEKEAQTTVMVASRVFANGACLRVPLTGRVRRSGQSINQQIDQLLQRIETTPESCDLVLDLGLIPQVPGYSAQDISRALDELEDIGAYRNLALIGTSIPDTLAPFGHDSIGELTRHELVFWSELRELPLERQPTFGDYIVQAPRRPSGMGRPVANIRYTARDRVLIARGHKLAKGDRAQYRFLCNELAGRREFRGAGFSWGDSEIATYASGGDPPLGQQHWRAVGSSHHFEEAVEAVGSR